MKKFLILYVLFSLMLLVFIYFFTLIQETNKRVLDVNDKLAKEALETKAIDPFLKYQSIAYKILHEEKNDTYDIYIVHVLGSGNETHFNQFSVFVFPNKSVNHAVELHDSYDQTGIRLTETGPDIVIYETIADFEYDDYAVSYGIAVIGFYFYAVTLDQSHQMTVTLMDYEGDPFFQREVDYHAELAQTISDIQHTGNIAGTDFILGYDEEEIEALLDLESYLRPVMMKNVTIFLVLDIAVGAFLFQIMKMKRQKETGDRP